MNTISISDLRNRTAKFVSQVANMQKIFTITQHSKPKAILVNHKYYQALEEAVLDLTDTKEAEKAKKETIIKLNTYVKKRWEE